jgi:predicted secreted Zn-dependent protease
MSEGRTAEPAPAAEAKRRRAPPGPEAPHPAEASFGLAALLGGHLRHSPSLDRDLIRTLVPSLGNQGILRLVADESRRARAEDAPALTSDRARDTVPDAGVVHRQAAGNVIAREAAPAKGQTVFPAVAKKTYPVAGKTLSEALAVIEAYQSQTGEAGKTDWNPKLKYDLDDDGNLKSATVTVNLTVTMPSWPGASKLSPTAKAEWDRCWSALSAHEDRHVAIAREKMEGVGESLVGKSESEANTAFADALTALKEASDAIDPFEVTMDVDA